MNISEADQQELQLAKYLLENPGLAAKLTNFIGGPLEKGIRLLPANWHSQINGIAETALLKASDAAMFTLKNVPGRSSSNFSHKLGVAVTGGLGGFFGLSAVAAELPVSTTIMLRSIADVARSEGEALDSLETKMACLEVFALGGRSEADDGAESGYFMVRMSLAKSVTDATGFLAEKALAREGAPALIQLVTKVAERFGLQVTEKMAAQAVPALGAMGGAVINTLFIGHFQDMARGHFIVRKLERKYGKEPVKACYLALL